jgi:hypothetical protein
MNTMKVRILAKRLKKMINQLKIDGNTHQNTSAFFIANTLIDYWHPDTEAFMLEGKSLTPKTEDIYFLNGLSRRGDPVNLRTFPPEPHNIEELIGLHCEASTEKVDSQVPIHKIKNISLKVTVLLTGWITRSETLH